MLRLVLGQLPCDITSSGVVPTLPGELGLALCVPIIRARLCLARNKVWEQGRLPDPGQSDFRRGFEHHD